MNRAEFEAIRKQFLVALHEGHRPSIDDYLSGAVGEEREALFVDLLRAELEWLQQGGETPDVDACLARFPGREGVIRLVIGQLQTPTVEQRDELNTVVGPAESKSWGKELGMVPQSHRFDVMERLGQGAFGSVWKAFDSQLGRLVALKTPNEFHLSPELRERFIRESRAAARLSHDGIVSVYDVCLLEDQRIAIVTQFVEGASLVHLQCKHQRFNGKEAAALCADLADALAHAHAQGVIHRDIKPANILVDHAGKAYLADFGLAKDLHDEASITREGDILGTVAYMSPEQAAGTGASVDGRSDVYGIGVVLYEMICGERPFRGTIQAVLQQVINDPPLPPQKLDARVDRDLQTIVLKCLEKRIEHRYQSAGELRDDLLHFVRNEPIVAKPPNTFQRFWKWYPWHATEMLGTYFIVAPLTWVFFILGGLMESNTPDRWQLSSLAFLPWALLWIGNGVMILKKGIWFEWANLLLLIPFLLLPIWIHDRAQSIGLIVMIGLAGGLLHVGSFHGRRWRTKWAISGSLVSRLASGDTHREGKLSSNG